jgi:hypothetical protein
MAHDLKLNIWKILLSPSFKRNEVLNSDLFGRLINESTKTEPFDAFLEKYVQSFDGKFKKSEKGDKSFAPSSNLIILSNRNIIHGFIEGGITGINQTVKPNSDVNATGQKISPNDVVEVEHYFLLWIPPETNYAYVMLQSYSDINKGISVPFFEHFQHVFLKSVGYTIRAKQSKVPESIQKVFREKSIIIGMDIIKARTSPSQRQLFNPAFQESTTMRFTLKIAGLKMSLEKFMSDIKRDKNGNPFFVNLSQIGLDNPEDYIAKVHYRDPETGKETPALLSNINNIVPAIILPDDIKQNGSEIPDISKIFRYCRGLLKQLQIEDGYATIDEFQNN